MKEITRVNHIGLRVSDFSTSCEFYAKLGFVYQTGPTGPEPVAIVEHPSGVNLNFILNANQEGQTNVLMDLETKHTGYTHLALEISNTEAVINYLKEMDIPLSDKIIEHTNGSSIFIRDPDNNVIEFFQVH